MTATNPTARLREDILAGLRASDSTVGDMTAEQLLDAYDGAFLAEVDRMRARIAELENCVERRRVRLATAESDLLNIRGALSPSGRPRRVPMELGARVAPAVEWLLNQVSELADARARALNEAADRIQARADQLGGVWLRADQVCEALRSMAGAPLKPEHGHDTNRVARALAEVRHLCEVTIASSVRAQAIDQARDTLDIINRVMGQQAGEGRG